jgi:hypothetical protein
VEDGRVNTDEREVRLEWASWVQVWWVAAKRQADRIENATFDDMQPDILLFIQALNNLARGARRVLGPEHPDMQRFEKALPGLKDLRDMLEHFDEYVEGEGWRQRRQVMPPGTPFVTFFSRSDRRDHTAIYVADTEIEVFRAIQDADALAIAVHLGVSN